MTPDERTEARTYLQQVDRFRRSLEVNSNDTQAGQAEGRIEFRYFVDANIVAAYANPAGTANYFRPLEQWIVDPDLKVATVTLLTEFLFSGFLPAQEPGSKIYMTSGHYNELANMAGGIAGKASKARNETTSAELRNQLDAMKQTRQEARDELTASSKKFSDGRRSLTDFIDDLGRLLPQGYARREGSVDKLGNSIIELDMMNRLVQMDKVVPAETERWFHSEIVKPNLRLVDQFKKDLQRVSGGKEGPTDEKLFADALSLVQIMALEREAPANKRYVFISADSSIRAAIKLYQQRQRNSGERPLTLHLRHPRDYVPLINLKTMAGIAGGRIGQGESETRAREQLSKANIFGEIVDAVNRLPKNVTPEKLADHWKTNRDAALQLWTNAAKHAIVLNANLLINREDATDALLTELLARPEIMQATIDKLNETIAAINTRNAVSMLRGLAGTSVAVFLDRAQSLRSRDPQRMFRRAPLLVREERFKKFIGDQSINDYLDQLVSGTANIPYSLLAGETSDALLFGACVSMAAESWHEARKLAEQALHRIEQDARGGSKTAWEARYCYAMTLRFTLDHVQDRQTASHLLERCIEEHDSKREWFRLIRARSEIGSLLGTFLYKEHCDTDFVKLSREEIEKLARDADRHIETAQDLLAQRQIEKPETNEDPLYQRIGLQIYANKAALAIFQAWVLNREPDMKRLRDDEAELRARIDRWAQMQKKKGHPATAPMSVRAPTEVFSVLVAESTREKEAAAKKAKKLLNELLKNSDDLIPIDKLEYEFFRSQLNLRFGEV